MSTALPPAAAASGSATVTATATAAEEEDVEELYTSAALNARELEWAVNSPELIAEHRKINGSVVRTRCVGFVVRKALDGWVGRSKIYCRRSSIVDRRSPFAVRQPFTRRQGCPIRVGAVLGYNTAGQPPLSSLPFQPLSSLSPTAACSLVIASLSLSPPLLSDSPRNQSTCWRERSRWLAGLLACFLPLLFPVAM